MPTAKSGLVLTGGGARGAYQAGVARGLADIAATRDRRLPFRVLSGLSAGALNASFLAATADDFCKGAADLAGFWARLRTDQVFRTDVLSIGKIGWRLGTDVLFGGMRKTKHARSLLDTTPLRQLLTRVLPLDRVAANIAAGALEAVEIAATDYGTSDTVSFFASADPNAGWTRARRRAERTALTLDHVMASAALPLFFPPVAIAGRHFGDGCLRNQTPLSPAIHLGADRLLIVGVRAGLGAPAQPVAQPTLGRVLSVVLNALLMDSTESDLERLTRINRTLQAIPATDRGAVPLRHVDVLTIKPSEDLGAFAATQFDRLPEAMRYLVSGLGSRTEASELVSYLLFEPEYCGYLAELGRKDALTRRAEIEAFLYA